MLPGRTIFAELMSHVSPRKFQTCVDRYDGDYKASRFSCWDQYLCMAFAQLTYRESLRDIEACLRAVQPKLYHVGIRARVARSTLADANETRDWRIYADFANGLIRTARAFYVDEPLSVDLADTVYALDATIIELCLSVFPWAHYRRRDAAIKLHTLVDLRGAIPTVVQITAGKCPDVTALDTLVLEAGAIYLMDRGYVDFARLYRFVEEAAFFVTRTKTGIRFTRRSSRPVDFTTGLISDHVVVLTTKESRDQYPQPLRRVRYVDPETKKPLVFLTNNFTLPPFTIAQLYKARWQVETYASHCTSFAG
ncbi:IS4 family transposase [Candidatus Bathyarchaeota archaeon]|nr:IS4 family transposase [Candidatus Bathyarchaeota archaeon]